MWYSQTFVQLTDWRVKHLQILTLVAGGHLVLMIQVFDLMAPDLSAKLTTLHRSFLPAKDWCLKYWRSGGSPWGVYWWELEGLRSWYMWCRDAVAHTVRHFAEDIYQQQVAKNAGCQRRKNLSAKLQVISLSDFGLGDLAQRSLERRQPSQSSSVIWVMALQLEYRRTFIDVVESPKFLIRYHSMPALGTPVETCEDGFKEYVRKLSDPPSQGIIPRLASSEDKVETQISSISNQGSLGSLGHDWGLCKRPCALYAAGNCKHGADCGFCHMVHECRLPKLDKQQREKLKMLSVSQLLGAGFNMF